MNICRIGQILVLASVLVLFVRTPARSTCVGDCDGSEEVTIEELVAMVNVALGTASSSSCPAGDANADGTITIEEIVSAVNAALNGCPQTGTCTTAFVTVALEFDATRVTDLAGVTLEVDFASDAASLPAATLRERVADVSTAGGFFDAQLLAGSTATDGRLRISYLTPATIPAGPLLEVSFDCTAAQAPREADFRCRVLQAADSGGFSVNGVSCGIAVEVQ